MLAQNVLPQRRPQDAHPTCLPTMLSQNAPPKCVPNMLPSNPAPKCSPKLARSSASRMRSLPLTATATRGLREAELHSRRHPRERASSLRRGSPFPRMPSGMHLGLSEASRCHDRQRQRTHPRSLAIRAIRVNEREPRRHPTPRRRSNHDAAPRCSRNVPGLAVHG